jgi:transposase
MLGMSRYDLTDLEWRVIEPLLPNKPRGVPRVDDRRVLNGIFWVLRSGAPWRDLPERYGPRTTCYNRFVRWRKAGVWHRLMDTISAAHDGEIQMIDSTSIRAHQQAATAKKGMQIIVSVGPKAGSRPKSTSSSTRKDSRSGSA